MRLRLDGATFHGRAIDLGDRSVDPGSIATAVREAGPEDPRESAVAVGCPPPGPGHEPLSVLPGGTTVRGLLAAAARSRGLASAVDAELATVERELAETSIPSVDVEAARRRVAAASGEEERLRERVATLRGRLRERRDLAADADDVAEAYREATASLAEAETERVAAEQALARAEERARGARERRDRRLALQDRRGNLRRRARAELAAAVHDEFAGALDAVPGSGAAGDAPEEYEGDRLTAALAAVRIADLAAPVVLAPATRRFGSAVAAADRLAAPVIRLPEPA